MLVALVADDVRVLDADEVLGADYGDVESAHGAADVAPVLTLRLRELLLRLLQPLVVGQNALLDFVLALHELVLRRDVLQRELADVDAPARILVDLLEELLNDLLSMLIVNAALRQEQIHLLAVDTSVAISIDHVELLP